MLETDSGGSRVTASTWEAVTVTCSWRGDPKAAREENRRCLVSVTCFSPGLSCPRDAEEPQDQSKGTEAAVCVPSWVTQRRGWESSSIAGPSVTHPASSDAKPSAAQPLLIRRELQTHVLSPNATTTWVVALLGPS